MTTFKNYKPNIDGLRGLSIISVFIYHLKIEYFSEKKFFFAGGFLGVDIFFLISGFLITKIILENHENHKFFLKEFFFRRLRRILPSLMFLILLVVSFFIYFNIIGYQHSESFINSSIFSFLGLSNIFFYAKGTQYGNSNDIFEPLLHTWSLSIEIQFYLFFSILIFFILKSKFKNKLNLIILTFFILSIASTIYFQDNSQFLFYSPITRIWCFAIGVLAFLNKEKITKFINLKIDTACLLIIIICFFLFDTKIWHPSFITLIPVLCATYLILSENSHTLSYKILTNGVMLRIGIISYSIYLWHFPVISLHRHFYIQNSYGAILSIILLTIFFSLISYNFIEKYFRTKGYKENFIFLTIIIFLISSFIIISKKKNFFEDNLSPKFKKIYLEDLKLKKNDKLCINTKCIFNKNQSKKLFLIGDSVFEDVAVKLIPKLKKNNFNVTTFLKSGCFLFPEHNKIDVFSKKIEKNCSASEQSKIVNELSLVENSIIIFHARYALYFLKKEFDNKEGGIERIKWKYNFLNINNSSNHIQEFSKLIREISKKNKIILIYPLPEVGWDLPERTKYLEFKNKFFRTDAKVTTSFDIFKERNKKVFQVLDNIKNKNIKRFYPHLKFCSNTSNRCITQINNKLLYRDYVHLTKNGVELFLKDLMKIINE